MSAICWGKYSDGENMDVLPVLQARAPLNVVLQLGKHISPGVLFARVTCMRIHRAVTNLSFYESVVITTVSILTMSNDISCLVVSFLCSVLTEGVACACLYGDEFV